MGVRILNRVVSHLQCRAGTIFDSTHCLTIVLVHLVPILCNVNTGNSNAVKISIAPALVEYITLLV